MPTDEPNRTPEIPLAPRHARPNLVLALMLLTLHAALVLGLGTGASRAMLLAHFGLFLLWQPVWSGTRRLVPSRALMVFSGGGLLVWADTWWLVGVWIALLFALIGGNVPGMRALRPRIAPLVAALYLLMALLMWVVPNLFHPVATDSFLALVVRYGLPAPLVMILALPGDRRDQSAQGIDPVSTVLLFLMVIVLTLGALFVQQITASDYPIALAQTVMGLAAILLLMSWLWDPRGGYAGLGQLVSRYFLSLGVPFEQWTQEQQTAFKAWQDREVTDNGAAANRMAAEGKWATIRESLAEHGLKRRTFALLTRKQIEETRDVLALVAKELGKALKEA